ncbi:ester cyclase [Flavobacteriaceae bacterium F89]|uniref:Ester cyclase n=1 Tax=Cerina litoralis TaxID=2874477 RepID=A0AAE3ERW8_9FLAO|nr:ester cyclase [Cerina litoralis]MCG2459273.1 ester cyclase [Cerina litoralis]
MKLLKNSILLGLVLVLFTACNNKQRYTQQSQEIETVKALIQNYNNKAYDTSMYADTSKTFYNTLDKSMSPSETVAYHKANDANYSSRGFTNDDPEYEMVITDNGETWVNCWPDWQGTLAENGKVITIPIHLTYRFVNGKIVREVGMWDNAPGVLAIQEIEAEKNRSTDEKAIQSTVENVVKAWNANDKDLLNANTASNIIRTANGNTIAKDQSEYGDFMDVYHGAFPDFAVKLDNLFIDGNKAYINWTCTGTNKGEFMGNPPTGKKIKTHGYSIWSFEKDGKADREDAFYDNLVVYQQLGYSMPMPK